MNRDRTRTLIIALGVVVCCLIGFPHLYDKFMIARFVAATTGLAIAFLFALIGKRCWLVPHTPVFYTYLLFVCFNGCSILWATNKAEAIFTCSYLLLSLFVIILFYSLLSKEGRFVQKTLWVSAAVILTVYLLFALAQLFHIENFSYEQLYRVSGINGHKNLLAGMLFVLSTYLFTSFSVDENKLPKVLSVVLFAIAIAVIILLKSRAVLLSVLVAGGFFGVLCFVHKKRQCFSKRAKTITLVTTIVLAYAFFTVGLRWFAARSVPHSAEKSEVEAKMMSTSSLVERCLLWDKTYRIADKHPLAGCGVGNWQIHFPDAGLEGLYRADVWNVNFTKPHNEYLGVLSETGYLGLLLYVVFLVSLVVRAFFALCENKSRKEFLNGALVLSIFVGSCVNALFDFPNSRIEHIIWMGILMAILLQVIARGRQKRFGKGSNLFFLLLAVMLVVIGVFRYKGDHNTFEMQHALKANDWKSMERYCHQAQSVFYTIDPVGLPVHWYQGKAEKMMGNPKYILSFGKAHRYAPYCKENLNDLGLASYHAAHDLRKAEFYLNEAIRISPNYLYPYFNLAYIYLSENEPEKAKTVADQIYFDEHKREVMKADAGFFEPYNTEVARQKIDADYQATLQLHKAILDKLQNKSDDQ